MDIVPILPGQPHPSILHILSEGSIQLLGGGGGGGGGVILLTAQMCVVLSLWSYNIISTIGVTARLMGDQGIVLQKSKGVLHLKTC